MIVQKKILKNFLLKKINQISSNSYLNHTLVDGLIYASLRGIDSHGIRLFPHYYNSLKYGRKNINPKFKSKSNLNHILVDADHAPGIVAGAYAMQKGSEILKKKNYSSVILSVIKSSHPGAMSSIISYASKKNLWCLGMTNADSLMQSPNGIKPFFGTNPIACTFPRIEEHPFMLDMATTIINWNKLQNLRNSSEKSTNFYGSDINGKMTKNISKITQLLPIGDYKGFGLASIVDLFCAAFTREKLSKDIDKMFAKRPSNKREVSQFYILGKINSFCSSKNFKNFVQDFSNNIRKEKTKNKKKNVMCPGDPEIDCFNLRSKTGIPINESLYKEIDNL